MRPFPRANPDEAVRKRLWEEYRQELISTAGICLLVLGNKRIGADIVLADGVRREFEIAHEHRLFVVPVGASGYMALELWKQVATSFDDFYPNASAELRESFMRLGDVVDDPAKLISRVLGAIALIAKE